MDQDYNNKNSNSNWHLSLSQTKHFSIYVYSIEKCIVSCSTGGRFIIKPFISVHEYTCKSFNRRTLNINLKAADVSNNKICVSALSVSLFLWVSMNVLLNSLFQSHLIVHSTYIYIGTIYRWGQMWAYTYMLPVDIQFKYYNTNRLKVKGWWKIIILTLTKWKL